MRDITISTCVDVYEPREDSYLMTRAIQEYAKGTVLDMGTGSGILGISAALKGCKVTFCDININAIECAKLNAQKNSVDGEFIISDLFSNIKNKFDTILFNPPYLDSEKIIDLALDGGKNGRKHIDIFLSTYKKYINKDGIVLLLESSINNYQQDIKNFNAKVVLSKKLFFEELVILMLGI